LGLRGLQGDTQLSLLLVAHNLALIRSTADSVVVMSRGRIVEHAAAGVARGALLTAHRRLSSLPDDRAPSPWRQPLFSTMRAAGR